MFHRLLLDQIKTGDLVAYSGRGPVEDFVKLRSGSEFSHLGMVLKVPNPATSFVETFVIEVTQNREELIDAWHENPVNGITIFRLDERLCQFYGNAIWLVPLNVRCPLFFGFRFDKPRDSIVLQKDITYGQEKALLKFTHGLHLRRSHQYVTPAPLPSLTQDQLGFLKDFNCVPKYIRSLTELWSPIFTYQALRKAKVIKSNLTPDVRCVSSNVSQALTFIFI